LIPVNAPLLTEADVSSVMEALRSGWISGAGPHIESFEAGWAAYCGRKHGIAVANGSVALQVAISLLDLEPGDEVILPSFTIISCIWPIVLANATPVLVDSDPRTWTMDIDQVRQKITSRTRAIMPVPVY
jgi:perosamine synthetase